MRDLILVAAFFFVAMPAGYALLEWLFVDKHPRPRRPVDPDDSYVSSHRTYEEELDIMARYGYDPRRWHAENVAKKEADAKKADGEG